VASKGVLPAQLSFQLLAHDSVELLAKHKII